MSKKKWSNPKGKPKIKYTIRQTGFNSIDEMHKYIYAHKINPLGYGYNKKDKLFFEYKSKKPPKIGSN